MAISEQDVTMVLMHEGYPLADGGTASFVVGAKDCLTDSRPMNANGSNAGGWDGSDMRQTMANEVFPAFPSYLRNVMKKMNVWTANGGNQAGTVGVNSEDNLALPACQIESWYKTEANRVKKLNGAASHWGYRSPVNTTIDTFCNGTQNSGSIDTTIASEYTHISPFGCI